MKTLVAIGTFLCLLLSLAPHAAAAPPPELDFCRPPQNDVCVASGDDVDCPGFICAGVGNEVACRASACVSVGASGATGTVVVAFERAGATWLAVSPGEAWCNAGDDNKHCTAVALTGDATGSGSAVSLLGDASGRTVVVGGDDAVCWGTVIGVFNVGITGSCAAVALLGSADGPVAVSLLGEAAGDSVAIGGGKASGAVANLALLGPAEGPVAGSALGDATGTLAASGAGDARGTIAASLAGDAEGGWAVSALGHAHGTGPGGIAVGSQATCDDASIDTGVACAL